MLGRRQRRGEYSFLEKRPLNWKGIENAYRPKRPICFYDAICISMLEREGDLYHNIKKNSKKTRCEQQ
ncbi:hypothetical protein ETC05_06385 [Geobacillus sp. BMUD]|nr:hypothetical protein [Geobacillus sp. BMUD]